MATFTVTTLEDTVNASDGKLSLREALTAANANVDADTINFLPSLENGTLVLTQGPLSIANDTTIDGDLNNNKIGVEIDGNFKSQVFVAQGLETDLVLDGLTITGGSTTVNGAGVSANVRSLTISNCNIEHNVADDVYGSSGGGVFCSGYLSIKGSIISGNSAGSGGGIFANICYVADSLISANGANAAYSSSGGGGIYAETLRLVRTDVLSNTLSSRGSSSGAGIAATYVCLENCTVAGNVDSDDSGLGGGISATTVVAANTTVTNNQVNGYPTYIGGGIAATHMQLSNCIVLGNVSALEDNEFIKHCYASDIYGGAISSNGHNILGTITGGAVEGDVVGAAPAQVFLAIDPEIGGGELVLINGTWVVPLRDALDNPALSGADPASSGEVDQRGVGRPQPGTSNPDIGAYELNQTHISTTATAGNDVLSGSAAANTLSGKAGNDLLLGLAGNDTLKGEAGGDTLQGGVGDDRLDGGTGIDTASYRDATGAVQANLINGKSGGAAGIDTLISIEGLVGSAFNDSLGGNAGSNAINGLAGNDKLYGDAGDDSLRGGNGDDSLWGGLGNDRLDGGAGKDTANYSDATAAVQANLIKGTSGGALGNDKLFSIENLTGGAFKDTLGGDAGANTLQGGGGDDKLYGDAGNDNLQGQDGNDTLFGFTGDDKLDGGAGIDTASYADITGAGVTVSLALSTAQLTGGGGKDILLNLENLIGSALADSLTGSSGANTLTGGLGKDMLKGNAGNDLFDFNAAADSVVGANADWITDFTGAGATVADRIDLADVYGGTLSFKGMGAFTGVGQVRVTASGSDTIVQVNLSGTTAPEMEIHVQDGAATPGQWVAGDFIL